MENLAGLDAGGRHRFVKGDITDRALVDALLREHRIEHRRPLRGREPRRPSITGPAAFVHTTWSARSRSSTPRAASGSTRSGATLRRAASTTSRPTRSTDRSAARTRRFTRPRPTRRARRTRPPRRRRITSFRAYHQHLRAPGHDHNCSNNYGPLQHPEKLIPTVIPRLPAELPSRLRRRDDIRDWLYVSRPLPRNRRVLRRGEPGASTNIGGDKRVGQPRHRAAHLRIFDELHPDAAPHARLISFVKDRPGHDFRYGHPTPRR